MRSGTALVAAIALLMTAPTGSAADMELGHRGEVGPHRLIDGGNAPGAACRYRTIQKSDQGYEIALARISVRPPRMRSVGAVGKVDWRIVLQRASSPDGVETLDWRTVSRGPIQQATAHDDEPAALARMGIDVDAPRRTDRHFRVLIRMRWHDADGGIAGSARHAVEWYRSRTFYGGHVAQQPCVAWEAAAAS